MGKKQGSNISGRDCVWYKYINLLNSKLGYEYQQFLKCLSFYAKH